MRHTRAPRIADTHTDSQKVGFSLSPEGDGMEFAARESDEFRSYITCSRPHLIPFSVWPPHEQSTRPSPCSRSLYQPQVSIACCRRVCATARMDGGSTSATFHHQLRCSLLRSAPIVRGKGKVKGTRETELMEPAMSCADGSGEAVHLHLPGVGMSLLRAQALAFSGAEFGDFWGTGAWWVAPRLRLQMQRGAA